MVDYKVELATKGKKFRANMNSKYKDSMTGDVVASKWTVRCDGSSVWVTDRAYSYNGGPFEKSEGASHWKVDDELLRPQLFWKSNFLGGEAKEIDDVEIDGKKYKQFECQIGNAMGGTTKYLYAVDPGKGYYRRLSREFVGDSHVDMYDCTDYKDSTSVPDSEFSSKESAEDMMRFDIFDESL